MQEINEGNVYDVQNIFGARLNSSALGIKNFKTEMKSQLFDYLKRNKVQNPEQVVKQTFGELLERAVDVSTGGNVNAGDLLPSLPDSNKTGAGIVVVTNPTGDAFNSPTSGFGMGFELHPTLVPSVQQFVDMYADKENGNIESDKYQEQRAQNQKTPENLQNVTWQKMNNSVANYVSQRLKDTLQKFHAYLPDEHYQNQGSYSASNAYHYDPYSRQVYRINKFRSEPQQGIQ